MTETPRCVGGPVDGMELPARYAVQQLIQVPIRDNSWNFATYSKDPKNPTRFLFQGFVP